MALFLGKARHDGQQQLALSVKGVNVLLFKEYLNTFFLQLLDGNEAVNRVSCESADRFCDDEVDFAGHGIGNHLVESNSVLCVGP